MATQLGIISTLSEKVWSAPNGDSVILHSFQLENTNRWFRTGRKAIGYDQGACIKFMCDAKGNVDFATVETATGSAPAPAPAQAASTGSYTSPRDTYWEDKAKRDVVIQRDIAYQAARNASIAVLGQLLTAGAVPQTKAKKMDIVLDLVDEITERYVDALPSNSDNIVTKSKEYTDDDGYDE